MNDHRAFVRPRNDPEVGEAVERGKSVVEVIGLEQRVGLVFISHDDIDAVADELHERTLVPLDAERIRQRQRDGRAVRTGDVYRLAGERRSLFDVPDIALEQHDFGLSDRAVCDIGKPELGAGAQVGVHRALSVFGNQHKTASGRGAVLGPWQADIDAKRLHVVVENSTELVVVDLADIGSCTAEVGKTSDRVGDRPAGHLGRRTNRIVDLVGSTLVDEIHRSRNGADILERVVINVCKNIHDCIADTENLY